MVLLTSLAPTKFLPSHVDFNKMSYLLQGGLVATFTKDNQPHAFKADVLVEGSTITQIGEHLPVPAGTEVLDCRGRWVTPGMIDTHRYAFPVFH